jgi:hypothetical protein
MASPGTYNFPVYQGDDLTFNFTYKEGASGSEVGKTLTGATILCQIKPDKASAATTTMTCTADADQVTNIGKMSVTLPAANSALLTGSSYVYDIQVTWAAGDVQTPLAGIITVTQDVSSA